MVEHSEVEVSCPIFYKNFVVVSVVVTQTYAVAVKVANYQYCFGIEAKICKRVERFTGGLQTETIVRWSVSTTSISEFAGDMSLLVRIIDRSLAKIALPWVGLYFEAMRFIPGIEGCFVNLCVS